MCFLLTENYCRFKRSISTATQPRTKTAPFSFQINSTSSAWATSSEAPISSATHGLALRPKQIVVPTQLWARLKKKNSALGLPVVYSSHKQSSTFFFLSAWLFTPYHTSNLLCTISLESLLTRIERGSTSLKSASSFSHKIPMRILYNKNNHKEVEKTNSSTLSTANGRASPRLVFVRR